jgi:threonine dehydrogenase-like Zn-dependent dehydrogenase
LPPDIKQKALSSISDSSLLLLADILPTGVFAATQAINHPKVAPVITGKPWPLCFSSDPVPGNEVNYTDSDRILTIAIIGLGPVGVCATVSMLDVLATRKIPFRIVAIDPIQSRREKMQAVYNTIDKAGKGTGDFAVLPIEEAKVKVEEWTGGVGATAVLEVSFRYLLRKTATIRRFAGSWKY